MKERLQTLLSSEKIASSKFADILGVNRSSISHLLSGRNNPSLDFLQRVLKKFPHINPDWLLLGQGNMYRNDSKTSIHKPAFSLFNEEIKEVENSPNEEVKKEADASKDIDNVQDEYTKQYAKRENNKSEDKDDIFSYEQVQKTKEAKRVDKIVFFYTDKSFEVYYPDKF